MRFAMTARTLVRQRSKGLQINDITAKNVAKVTRFRPDGKEELEQTVQRLGNMDQDSMGKTMEEPKKRKVYPVSADKPKKARWTMN